MDKLVKSVEDVLKVCGLRDGMCVSFHHHLRNGDLVLPMVMRAIGKLGYKDIKISATAIMDGMAGNGLPELVRSGVITEVDTNNTDKIMGRLVSQGAFPKIAKYRTQGGRPRAVETGEIKIDIAFIAASTADPLGNCNGIEGPSAFGSIGYAMTDARYADKVVVVTDNLVPYPLQRASIDETFVDYVVKVESIGDPDGIATGVVKTTSDPIALILAKYTAGVIGNSGLFRDGFSFQAGAGGAAIATTQCIKRMMKEQKIHGSFLLGGITGYSVDLLNEGLFENILDVQSFDRKAAASMRDDPRHREISDSNYANPLSKSCAVNQLDVVVLGALQVDTAFNVNVVVNSAGYFTGGSGGHSDTAAGSKLAIVVVPLTRTRIPTIVEKLTCQTTPGKDINTVVTQYGVAVNPNNPELKLRLKDAGIKLIEIEKLRHIAEKIAEKPEPVNFGDRVVGEIISRDGIVIDRIRNVI